MRQYAADNYRISCCGIVPFLHCSYILGLLLCICYELASWVCAGGRAAVAGNPELSVGGMVDSQDGDRRCPLHRRCAEPGRMR
jgi:hypothetical protein